MASMLPILLDSGKFTIHRLSMLVGYDLQIVASWSRHAGQLSSSL
jgi:Ni/Fe-hydrogenase subunit HybB-like protein